MSNENTSICLVLILRLLPLGGIYVNDHHFEMPKKITNLNIGSYVKWTQRLANGVVFRCADKVTKMISAQYWIAHSWKLKITFMLKDIDKKENDGKLKSKYLTALNIFTINI